MSLCTVFLREMGYRSGGGIELAHVGLMGDIFEYGNEPWSCLNVTNFFTGRVNFTRESPTPQS